MIWQCGTFSFDTDTPIIMGILNVTPDSFSDGSQYFDEEAAVAHADEMMLQGASIIDVGGESTRPGAQDVDPHEEWDRIGGVVRALVARGYCVSVDTRHAYVATCALAVGASIINDVSGFSDAAMVEAVKDSDAGLVVMHMQGTPTTMQDDPHYDDVVAEVRDYLKQRCAHLEHAGIAHERICIDPGPGFGKTYRQTIELMRNIHEFARLGYPVMAACSRKGYVGYAYHIDEVLDRDEASATEALMACELGASVVRTHNVAVTVQFISQLRPFVILSLGSNVALVARDESEVQEGIIAQLNQAIAQLCTLPDTQIIDIAGFYGSKPAYYTDQDDFINTAVLLRTGIPPLELLGYLQSIENSLGRVRTQENGPRTLDIDIVDYQLYNYANETLTLPHPKATERDFVVKPVSEIRPFHVLANGHALEEVPEASRVGASWPIDW